MLARTVMTHISEPVNGKPVSIDGAQKAAGIINDILVGVNKAGV